MPLGLQPPTDAQRLETSRGSIAVWHLGRSAYASSVSGHLTLEMAEVIKRCGDSRYGWGMVHGFHDWLEMTSYDSSARVLLTNWVMEHRAESRLYIGVRSRIVAMGVAVANLALGNLIAVRATREELEADLRDAIRT